jgi:hypothetical protein
MSDEKRIQLNDLISISADDWKKFQHQIEENLTELQEARAEIGRLRELLLWRKWPEEKPKCDDIYQVIFDEESSGLGCDADHIGYDLEAGGWDWSKDPIYWRPIGELPKTEAGVGDG